MGRMIKDYDWSQTSLGHFTSWPPGLRITLSILLQSKFPMILFWGKDHVCFYNDAFSQSLCNERNHPSSLGKRGEELFGERWGEIYSQICRVSESSEATLQDGLQMPVYRQNNVEDVKCMYSYNPVYDESDEIAGVIVTVSENINKKNEKEEQAKEPIEAFNPEILASYQLQALVLERIDEGVSVSDEKGFIKFTNPAEDKMFGYEPGELIGKHVTIQNAYNDEENASIVESAINELKTKGFSNGEWHNRKKDGTEFYTHSFITAIEIEGETLFVCVQRDITQKKVDEENLAYRTALLEAQSEAIPDGILVVDTKGKILSSNQHFAEIWNIPQDIIDARDDVAALQFAMTQVADPGKFIERVNYCYAHPDEVILEEVELADGRILERYGHEVTGENGIKYGYIWYFRDITERRKVELNLKESESRFRVLAETLPQLIWMRNVDGTIEYASKSWEEYTGIKDLKLAWKTMVHPDDEEPVMAVWKNAWENGISFNYETRLKNYKGEFRWFNAVGEPLKDDSGKVLKYIGAMTDIHIQKTFSENLEALVAERTFELQRSNEELEQFAHVTSHDLKEPIRKVMIFGSRLRNELKDKISVNASLYLDKIENAAARMYDMIEGVLLYSSNTAGSMVYEEINLNTLISTIENDLEVAIHQKNARIKTEFDVPVIKGSPFLINQLFYNLVSNSLKFTSNDRTPEITIKSRKFSGEIDGSQIKNINPESEYVAVAIQDNGIGFDQNQSEKIFKTFTRLHSRQLYEGTGLGLAMCKKIVEKHKGIIYARSNVDNGAEFTVLIPLV